MRNWFLLYFYFSSIVLFSQNKFSFVWPLDSPKVLSANYGQLRPNHFHAGIDISTRGTINLPVYAAEQGYVSRIKVSGYGYGKAVYITHPNGKVTVYGHLNAYSKKIDTIIRKEQSIIQSYEIDYYPKQKIPIKKGEIIARSGNTGGSTGPHLHFEIRDELSEIPLNPLNYFKLKDYVSPSIQALALFNLSDTLNPHFLKSIKVKNVNDKIVAETPSITIQQSIIGFAFAGYDRMVPGGHLNNIYSSKLYIDDHEIYTHLLQAVSFDESRYVNQYAESANGLVYQKCFLPVLAPADFVMNSSKRTRVILNDTNFHLIKLIVADEYGNQNQVQFHLKTNRFTQFHSNVSNYDLIVDCRKDLKYSKNNLSLQCPAYTFFISSPLIIENTLETTGKLCLLPGDVNLKTPLQVRFTIPKKYQNSKSLLVLKNNGNIYTGSIHGDSVAFYVKNLGWFQLDVDAYGPTIVLAAKTKKKSKLIRNTISFIIKDAVSGIGNYKLYINNQWVLAEFDAKNSLLFYQFDNTSPHGNLDVRLEVSDKVGNKTIKNFQVNR